MPHHTSVHLMWLSCAHHTNIYRVSMHIGLVSHLSPNLFRPVVRFIYENSFFVHMHNTHQVQALYRICTCLLSYIMCMYHTNAKSILVLEIVYASIGRVVFVPFIFFCFFLFCFLYFFFRRRIDDCTSKCNICTDTAHSAVVECTVHRALCRELHRRIAAKLSDIKTCICCARVCKCMCWVQWIYSLVNLTIPLQKKKHYYYDELSNEKRVLSAF